MQMTQVFMLMMALYRMSHLNGFWSSTYIKVVYTILKDLAAVAIYEWQTV